MPRNIDPDTIKTGPGFKSADSQETDTGSSPGLTNHTTATSGAHPATAIDIDDEPPLYDSNNVEGALDELASLIPPRPPKLGEFSTLVGISGIPDWGSLKLNDGAFDERPGSTAKSWDTGEAYAYWQYDSDPAIVDPPFDVLGADPATDTTFNVTDGTYTGGGEGETHAGAFTRNVGGPNPIQTSNRLVLNTGSDRGVVVSGAVYPADRGVLALIQWPADGDSVDFLAQSLTERCLAAILLGQGVNSSCDGKVGGIFTLGDDGSGGVDPFAYPGQATGQYDLRELHTALSTIDSSGLGFVADTTAGQVRLGTDPNAGPTVAGGIPILGAGSAATGGGDDNNFFRYRLPYLSDFSSATGLKYTPTAEKPRYFLKPSIAENSGVDLTEAGDYVSLPKDYWNFQVARFRHRFVLTNTSGGSSPQEDGTFILLHFKTEAAFESLVRDGVAPADADLYSPNLVDWTDPENPTNVHDISGALVNGPADSYHLIRSRIYEDPVASIAVTTSSNDYTLAIDRDVATVISGVRYLIPVDPILGNVTISDLNFVSPTNYWGNTFLTDNSTGAASTPSEKTHNPGILSLSPFSFDLNGSSNPTFTGGVTIDSSFRRRQRLELGFTNLVSGGKDKTDGPLPTDTISYTFTSPNDIDFEGDISEPAFSQSAAPYMYLFRPLYFESVSNLTDQIRLDEVSGNTVLFHSTQQSASSEFGNFTSLGGLPAAGTPIGNLENATKDTTERFLDEVYRYRVDWSGVTPAADQANLIGPGLPSGSSSIDIPVRAGSAGAPWDNASWLQQGEHLTDLSTLAGELQVAGLPERAPIPTSASTLALYPFPSAGILQFPKTDYTTGYTPSLGAGEITTAQPDYSGIPTTGDREYVRAFDIAFSRSGTPESMAGLSTFYLRIRGLELADYAYSAPGPGSTAIAIMVKVPGLTTWMDLGRADGSGPSKQDGFSDGAGCQVTGPSTFDGIEDETRVVFSEVEVNVGGSASFFLNSASEVPVLVKVIVKDSVSGRALDFTQGAITSDTANQRGLVGIEVVRPPA